MTFQMIKLRVIAFFAILYFSIKYRVSPVTLTAIAYQESNFTPDLTYHSDKMSTGLMGINVKGGAFNDYKKLVDKNATVDALLNSVWLNVKISAWYLGKIIPKYIKVENTLQNRLAAYNAGAGNVNKHGHEVVTYDEQVLERIKQLRLKVWLMYSGILIIPLLSMVALSNKRLKFFKRR